MNNLFQQFRLDGIINMLTGAGLQQYDASNLAKILGRSTLQQDEQSKLLKYGFIRKLVSKLPKASVARWGQPTIVDGDAETIEAIVTALDKIKVVVPGELAVTGVKTAFYKALFNAFLTGNGAIVIHTIPKNGKDLDLSEPIDLKNIRQIRKLVVLDRWEIVPDTSTTALDRTAEIEYFQIMTGGSSRVHASRVLWFEGEKLDRRGKELNQGCDESILDGIYECFTQYCGGIQGAARMLQDFDVIDIAVKGLWGMSSQQSQIIQERAKQNAQMQSIYRARIRDMEEESITHSTRTVGGYSDLLQMLKDWLLANTDYPPAVLFGEFSPGLNASGKTQEEKVLWNETIADLQAARLTHQLMGRHADAPGLLDILCACSEGPTKGDRPKGLGWKWNPLYTPSPTEQADLEMNRGQMAMTIAQGSPEFLAQYLLSAYGGNEYNPVITITPEYKKLLQDQAALIPPPAPEGGELDEYGNPIGTQYEESPETQVQQDSADDAIDRMVRQSVKHGIELFNRQKAQGLIGADQVLDRWMLEFADGGDLDSDDLIKWRKFWRNPKPEKSVEWMLHGGRWGKIWGNRP